MGGSGWLGGYWKLQRPGNGNSNGMTMAIGWLWLYFCGGLVWWSLRFSAIMLWRMGNGSIFKLEMSETHENNNNGSHGVVLTQHQTFFFRGFRAVHTNYTSCHTLQRTIMNAFYCSFSKLFNNNNKKYTFFFKNYIISLTRIKWVLPEGR